MKIVIATLFFFAFLSVSSYGQPGNEQEIRYLEKHWTQLLDKGDTTSLLKLWSSNYVVNNPYGEIATPESIVARMKGGHVFPKVERIIEKITFNQNIAIVMGKELQQPLGATTNLDEWIPRRFTNVWIWMDGEWKLAARQSSELIIR